MLEIPKYCAHCGKRLTEKEQKEAFKKDTPFCPKCDKKFTWRPT